MSLISKLSVNEPGNPGTYPNPEPYLQKREVDVSLREASLLLNNIPDGIVSTDLYFHIKSWNKGAEDIYGLKAREVIDMPASKLLNLEFLTDDRDTARERLRSVGKWKGDVLYEHPDGRRLYLEINSSGIRDQHGTTIGYVSICRDITDLHRIKERLAGEEARKKSELIKAIMEAQEKERKELSSELHDNVNQILTTCKLLLEIAGSNPAEPRFIEECYKNIQLVIHEIRNISHDLTPHTLKDLGLAAAIRDLVEKINQSGKLAIRTTSFLNLQEEQISPDIKLTLFRIIQECIGNTLKHSMAAEARIGLSRIGDRIQLQLTDNGNGFDQATVKRGLGLNSIHNRVEYYKGSLRLSTSPGQGCELIVELPCR